MFKKILFGLFLVLFVFVGTADAHGDEITEEEEAIEQNISGLLPGNFFYFLDIFSEGVGTLFTFGDTAKAERFIFLADERLAEVHELARIGESKEAEKATKKYQKRLNKALKKAKEAKDEGKDVDEVLSIIAQASIKHQTVLADVYDKVPEETKDSIEEAMGDSLKGYEAALGAISKEIQDEIQIEIEQLLEEIDTELLDLRNKGKKFPKMKIKHLDEVDEFFDFDDLDELDDMDELDDLGDLDEFDDDLDDLEELDKRFEKDLKKIFKDDLD